ncbi:TPA: hypothetical protein I8034_003043 [Legionella pneumophila]|nr:hypothetical protein [Legionella pneumophila]HAT2137525.1 hypothetical protein [Legionella pneumophila]HAT2143637.1 hypothetical protein [Legionella pneumophila]HAT2146794.1 hypothetical protein [Legionella pneumophila]HAT2161905.1 hypothetical protein [Legionella pneumophila]
MFQLPFLFEKQINLLSNNALLKLKTHYWGLLESSLAERGTAPWSETNKEHNFSMARIKELE